MSAGCGPQHPASGSGAPVRAMVPYRCCTKACTSGLVNVVATESPATSSRAATLDATLLGSVAPQQAAGRTSVLAPDEVVLVSPEEAERAALPRGVRSSPNVVSAPKLRNVSQRRPCGSATHALSERA